MKWQAFVKLVTQPRTLLVVYIVAALFAAIQQYSLGTHLFVFPKGPYPDDIMNRLDRMNQFNGKYLTEYNNYMIFKYSFFHLLEGTNLYGLYPSCHWDFYKYSPTFAVLMAPMAYLPDIVGLCIWNILNALAVYFAIRLLPFNVKTQCLLLWFVSFDLLTCLQNAQSNGLMCGLIIAAYGCLHHKKALWATLWLVVATYIKVYGAIGFCLFLFYPDKVKFVLYAIMWTILFWAIPLLVTPLPTLVWQYHNWAGLMIADATTAMGLSVAGLLSKWFGMNMKGIVTIAGLILFLLPFIRTRQYKNEIFRLLTLASMLIWVIIFNHKAESSTFVIATAGVGIWYFAMPKTNWRTALFFFVFIFTSLSTTDIFPAFIRQNFIYPFKIKAFPCVVAWCVVFADLMLVRLNAGRAPSNLIPEDADEQEKNVQVQF